MPWLVLDQTHKLTQTREVRSRETAERTQEAVRRFTRFGDYGLMFDSRRSFSLEYQLIRSPYEKNPRIVASPTSSLASIFYLLAFVTIKSDPIWCIYCVSILAFALNSSNEWTGKAIAPSISFPEAAILLYSDGDHQPLEESVKNHL